METPDPKDHLGPVVSVVIPTRNRPDLVLRAVLSALNQTFGKLEVIVVIDGPDASTTASLDQVSDARLRVIALSQSVGGSDARNAGVKASCGEWIAFLDDDDEWLPAKIEKQMGLAVQTNGDALIATRLIAQTPESNFLIPRRLPDSHEAICEYLFCQRSAFAGEAQIQTSAVLVNRKLAEAVPFTSGLRRHQDTEWYLRLAERKVVSFRFIDEPLVIWHLDENRKRISNTARWRDTRDWLRTNASRMTPRAYSGFAATQLAAEAEGDWRGIWASFREMTRPGFPSLFTIAIFLRICCLPARFRRRVRAWVHGVSSSASAVISVNPKHA